jgi:hypothetical protein
MFQIMGGMNWSVGYMSAEQQLVLIFNSNVYRGEPVRVSRLISVSLLL